MCRIRIKRRLVDAARRMLVFLLLLPYGTLASGGEVLTESVVVFNTICARCHEAECSGRLSFGEAFEKSAGHIRRYYGPASEKRRLQRELFRILNYMKERCAYYPMKTPVPLDRVWERDALDGFATLEEKNYFIPAGRFSPGMYRMDLELQKDAKVTVHFVSEEFEMAVEDCHQSSNKRVGISFSIEQSGSYYFRMYPREPVKILRFAISPLEAKAGAPVP